MVLGNYNFVGKERKNKMSSEKLLKTFESPIEKAGALFGETKDALNTVIDTLTKTNTSKNTNSSVGFFGQNDIGKKKNYQDILDTAIDAKGRTDEAAAKLGNTITPTVANGPSLGMGTSSSNSNGDPQR